MTSNPLNPLPLEPCRGEVWWVDLEPKVGAELNKIRPVVVVSSDAVGVLPIKLVAPIIGWQTSFTAKFWLVRLQPNSTNGLVKASAVDTLQLRGVDVQRFKAKLGQLPAQDMEEIAAAIAAVIEYT